MTDKSEAKEDDSIICAVMGAGAGGKTCLIDRFTKDTFDESVYYPEAQIEQKFTFQVDGQEVQMKIRDVEGTLYYQFSQNQPF